MLRILAGLIVVPVFAQVAPAAKPEPRRALGTDPLTIARNLRSGSARERAVGWRQLDPRGTPFDREVADLRIQFVNLDTDPALEAAMVVSYDVSLMARAVVFDSAGTGWNVAGDFENWRLMDSGKVDRMLRFEEHEADGMKDVHLRIAPSGSGILTWTELHIYRMRDGRLYRVFETTEEYEGETGGPEHPGWVRERHDVHLPDERWNGGQYLILHRTRAIAKGSPRSIGCYPYRFDQAVFRFVLDRAATERFCDPRTHRPRI